MTSTIQQLLKLGKYYSQNQLWPQADATFGKALTQLCTSDCVEREFLDGSCWPDLRSALQEVEDSAFDRLTCAEHAVLTRLQHALARIWQEHGVERARYMSILRAGDTQIIVFHDCQDIGFPELSTSIPTGDTTAFFVDVERRRLEYISPKAAAQIAYVLSHRAWAQVCIAIQLYTIGRVLIDDGIKAICEATRGYDHALLLAPRSAWTMAHIGETYRIIANSWPPSVSDLAMPTRRTRNYILALLYFKEATRLDDDDFWAHAHFGATVVNARAFSGVRAVDPLFTQFMHAWFPDHESIHDGTPLLHEALKSLNRAQELQGNFYPWAQLYAADVLIFLCTGDVKSPVAAQTGVLAMILSLDSFALQPELASNLSDPSALYTNPFFQISQLYFWHDCNSIAWQYAYMGLARAFKFCFIPKVEEIIGYQLLANIAQQALEARPVDAGLETRHINLALGKLPVACLSVPPQPFEHTWQLVEFVENVIMNKCRVTVGEFVPQSANPNVQLGLMQVCFILDNFADILAKHRNGTSIAQQEAKALMGEILDTCHFDKQSFFQDDTYENELFSEPIHMYGLSYTRCSRLKYIGPTQPGLGRSPAGSGEHRVDPFLAEDRRVDRVSHAQLVEGPRHEP